MLSKTPVHHFGGNNVRFDFQYTLQLYITRSQWEAVALDLGARNQELRPEKKLLSSFGGHFD
jgi:hypothetical protein